MKTVEIIGYKRANLGKSESRRLRGEGMAPAVLYGGKEQIHFAVPMQLFRDLVYTPDAHLVDLNIEGKEFKAILQDIQFHPVSEVILHADFLLLFDDKPVKMDIPVKYVGTSPGVQLGGKLVPSLRTVKVKALPKHLPDTIELDINELELGKSVRVRDIKPIEGVEVLNNPAISVASVEIPRALRGKQAGEEEEAES
ncbi:50S ribosomal protein L25/general stress protein Ctc [Xanthovirga aplysinae]|uniref:50S ribosomal protein L25/general stress protein Ctc n=1 Tax=Xanthovirga aplysinae TaxID=2529853 RepID=UPI0012BC81E0|nr:50S ribosomal protein L25/general stress protein Ctc [Xanthovirga aplysinae]MTI31986.1 50S ribosomal protein L25/general stress protein Ctc [Xanthovirga aplysinae]